MSSADEKINIEFTPPEIRELASNTMLFSE